MWCEAIIIFSYSAGLFIAKLNDCEAEAAETQTWIEFAVKCGYLQIDEGREIYSTYNQILGETPYF